MASWPPRSASRSATGPTRPGAAIVLAARRQGHGARRRRPRHLERRVLLHQPVVPVEQFDRLQAGRKPGAALPGPRRVSWPPAGWWSRPASAKGYPVRSERPAGCPPARAGADEPGLGHHRGRWRLARTVRDGVRDVRHHPGTRTCAGRLRALGPRLRARSDGSAGRWTCLRNPLSPAISAITGDSGFRQGVPAPQSGEVANVAWRPTRARTLRQRSSQRFRS